MSSERNFADLKYSELQKLAKDAGIKANMKSEKLIKSLQEHFEYIEKQRSQAEIGPTTDSAEKENQDVETKDGTSPPKSSVDEEQMAPKADTIKVSRRGNKRGKRQKRVEGNKGTEQVKEDLNLQLNRGKRKRSLSSPPQEECSNAPVEKPAHEDTDSQPSKRRRGTFELTPAAPESTQDVCPAQDLSGSRGENNKSAENSGDGSVGEVIESMNSEMNSPDLKESLLAAIDKKVEKRLRAEGEKVVTSSSSSSQIPRFAAFLAKKKEADKKPITPGNKNWTKVHQKNFNKMDSIDVYLAKKRKRTASITSSIRKAKEVAEKTREAMRRLNNHKTPEHTKRRNITASQSSKFLSPRIVKKVTPFKPTVISTKSMNLNFTAQQKTPLFGAKTDSVTIKSPKPSPGAVKKSPRTAQDSTFRPVKQAVTTTKSAAISTKPTVSTKPTITTSTPALTNTKQVTITTKPAITITTPVVNINKPTAHRKSLGVLNSAPRPEMGERRKSYVTPFKSGSLNITLENQSTAKKVFDLQASLSKPLSWKPHTGKLKPLDNNTVVNSHQRMVKEVTLKTDRTGRIAAAKDRRADKKFTDQMKRRGIVA